MEQAERGEPVEKGDAPMIACKRCKLEWVEDRLCSEAKFSVICDPDKEHVDHPAHYHAESGVEVIAAIEAWGLGFALGNVVKYVARAGRKDPAAVLEDLRKAAWYLEREIKHLEERGDAGAR